MPLPAGAVLYVCPLNRVRSPMAAGLAARLYADAVRVESCGLGPAEEIDPMAAVVMGEVGVVLMGHRPARFADMALDRFDVIIALSPQACAAVRAASLDQAPEVECWDVEDPTAGEGSREMRLEAYRQTRRDLERRITGRFGPPAEWE